MWNIEEEPRRMRGLNLSIKGSATMKKKYFFLWLAAIIIVTPKLAAGRFWDFTSYKAWRDSSFAYQLKQLPEGTPYEVIRRDDLIFTIILETPKLLEKRAEWREPRYADSVPKEEQEKSR